MADSTETRSERRAEARAARAERREAEARRERMRRRLWALGGAVVLAAVVVVAIVLATGGGDDKSGPPALKAGEQLPGQFEANARFGRLDQQGITVGKPGAPVTLVEFADLQCPFCRQFETDVMPTLVANYVRTGKMKMVFRNVSFIGDDSLRAAQMAAAAGRQNKLFPFVEIFYANQGEENTGYADDAFLRKIGSAVKGLNVEKAMSDRNLPAVQTQLTEAQDLWQANGFEGTPSFLLGPTGGKLKPLDQIAPNDLDAFKRQIDKALAST
jgi:protein-disulfide isomerase